MNLIIWSLKFRKCPICGISWAAVAHGVSGACSPFRVGGAQGGGGGGGVHFFQEFSSSVGEAFILAGGLGAGLSFYVV